MIVTKWRYRIDFPKKNFADRKALDKLFKSSLESYTGMAGKGFCFCFNSEAARSVFLAELVAKLDKNNCDSYEFFEDWGWVRQ